MAAELVTSYPIHVFYVACRFITAFTTAHYCVLCTMQVHHRVHNSTLLHRMYPAGSSSRSQQHTTAPYVPCRFTTAFTTAHYCTVCTLQVHHRVHNSTLLHPAGSSPHSQQHTTAFYVPCRFITEFTTAHYCTTCTLQVHHRIHMSTLLRSMYPEGSSPRSQQHTTAPYVPAGS
jgi:hypothetical protein